MEEAKLWNATVNEGGTLRVAGFVGNVKVNKGGILVVEKDGNVGSVTCWPGSFVTVSTGGLVQSMHDLGCTLTDNGFIKSRTYCKLC